MDPFSTPPSRGPRLQFAANSLVQLSKSTVIDLIRKIPFKYISIPEILVNNEESSTGAFLEAVAYALMKTFVQHPPPRQSPERLLSSAMSRLASREEQETPTKPRVKYPKVDPNMSGILCLQDHSYFSESTTPNRRQGSKFSVSPSADAKEATVLHKAKDDILVPVCEPYKFPEGYPLFGQWLPRESFVDNWAGTEFVRRLIDQELHVDLAKEASKARNGLKCDADLSSFNAGGTHVIVQLQFEDGVVWLARIRFPCCGIEGHQCVGGFTSFQDAAAAMGCEIATMAFVKERTSLPVPNVYVYNLSFDNLLHAPYMIIEKMAGESLERKLYRDGVIYVHQIKRVDKQVKQFMHELADIRFLKIGRLSVDGTIVSFPTGLGLVTVPGSPFNSAEEYYNAKLSATITGYGLEQILQESYQPANVGKWDTAGQTEKIELAMWVYLQVGKFLGTKASAGPFPLDHGDWNDQNVLVDADYRVVGVLDWELARTCCHECVKPSKLFQYTLRDVGESILVEPGRQMVLDTTPQKLQELGRLFERPVVRQQFVQQLEPLILFLQTNFTDEIDEIIPIEVRSNVLGT